MIELGCKIDSLWISSDSKPCPAVELIKVAFNTEVLILVPIIEHSWISVLFNTTSINVLVHGNVFPWMQQPTPSKKRSFICSKTFLGIFSKASFAENLERISVVLFSFISLKNFPNSLRCCQSFSLWFQFTLHKN